MVKAQNAAVTSNPNTDFLTHQLEMVQHNSTGFIHCSYTTAAGIRSIRSTLTLQTIELCRKTSQLCLFHKHHHYPILKEFLYVPIYVSERWDHVRKACEGGIGGGEGNNSCESGSRCGQKERRSGSEYIGFTGMKTRGGAKHTLLRSENQVR